MPNEQIYATSPKVLKWARLRAGFSIEEASKDFKKIELWEDEDQDVFPTYPQLERLSSAFKVPLAVFFFPEPPDLPPVNESFRTLPESEFYQIPPRIQLLVRKASAFQINLYELFDGQNPSKRLITKDFELEPNVDLSEITASVRDYIGVSIDKQISWNDVDIALKEWRNALLDVGVFVFKDAFRQSEYFGFSLTDDVFPIIYVNNSASKTRQIFTLFHELAHLLFDTSGLDFADQEYIKTLADEYKNIEVFCNKFAAEFLLPEHEYRDAIKGKEASEHRAELLARQFNVSREFIYRRFLDDGLIDQDVYLEAATRWSNQRVAPSGGNSYWSKISYLGREYIDIALRKYHQNQIDDTQLAEYLDSKPRHLETFEEYFLKGET